MSLQRDDRTPKTFRLFSCSALSAPSVVKKNEFKNQAHY